MVISDLNGSYFDSPGQSQPVEMEAIFFDKSNLV